MLERTSASVLFSTVPCRSQPVLFRVGQYSLCTGLVAAKGFVDAAPAAALASSAPHLSGPEVIEKHLTAQSTH